MLSISSSYSPDVKKTRRLTQTLAPFLLSFLIGDACGKTAFYLRMFICREVTLVGLKNVQSEFDGVEKTAVEREGEGET